MQKKKRNNLPCRMKVREMNIGTQSGSYFFDRSIRRTVYSNDLVKSFLVAMYSKNEAGNL